MTPTLRQLAYHELGHALVAWHYGAYVHEVRVGKRNYTTLQSGITDTTKYPSITVAGYVAEEIAQGHYPSGNMNGPQYYSDRKRVLEEVNNDLSKFDEAIKDAYQILNSEEMRATMEYFVPLLVKRGAITL
jgi:hypothetical protein